MPSTSELIRINREVPRIKAAIKDELDIAPSSYADPGGYLAQFVKNPLGKSYDFGEISKEAAQGIGRRPGPIRVELGDSATSGLIGIIKKTSSADVLAAGYGSMSVFIYRVGNNYTDIYDAIDNGAFLLVRERKGDGRFEILKVKTGYQGISWVVLEAFLCRKGYLESKRLLWTRTGTGTSPVLPVPIPAPVENSKPIDEVKEDSKPSQVMESAVPVEEWEQKILDAKDFMEIRAVVLRQIGLAKLKRRSDAKKAEVNEAVSINLEAMKDAVGAQFQNSKGKVILLSQSTKKENTYQVTYMDEEGPSGHTEFSSMEQAIRSISGEFSEGPPVGDSTFRTTRVIPKPVERIKPKTEVSEKHKKLIAKIKNTKDRDKKTSLWYDADLSQEEGEQIVRQMVLSLPGEYQLFGRGGGNSLVDKVFEVYGTIPSQFLNESFMLGMSVKYPERVSASFTHDLEMVTISDGKPKESIYLSRKEVIDGLKAHTEDIPSYIYLDKDGGSWRPNWDSERIVDFKLFDKLVNEGYLESDGIDGMLYVPVSKKSTDLKGVEKPTTTSLPRGVIRHENKQGKGWEEELDIPDDGKSWKVFLNKCSRVMKHVTGSPMKEREDHPEIWDALHKNQRYSENGDGLAIDLDFGSRAYGSIWGDIEHTDTDTKLYGDLEKDDIDTIFATITKDRSSQGRSESIELLFGDEEELASYDDGAEFSSPETQARWEAARVYSADIDHAIRTHDDIELRSLIEEAKKDYKKNLSKVRKELAVSDSAARRNRRRGDRYPAETTPILEGSASIVIALNDGSMDSAHSAEWWGDRVNEAGDFDDILTIFDRAFPAYVSSPSWRRRFVSVQGIIAFYKMFKDEQGKHDLLENLQRRKALSGILTNSSTLTLTMLGNELRQEIAAAIHSDGLDPQNIDKAIFAHIFDEGQKLHDEIITDELKSKIDNIGSVIDRSNERTNEINRKYDLDYDKAWEKYVDFANKTRSEMGYETVKKELSDWVRKTPNFESTQEYHDIRAKSNELDDQVEAILRSYHNEHVVGLRADKDRKLQELYDEVANLVPSIIQPVIDSIIESSSVSKEEADTWAAAIDIKCLQGKINDSSGYKAEDIPNDLSKLYRITGGSIKTINFTKTSGSRSSAEVSTSTINASDIFRRTSLYHEFGHIVEGKVLATASSHLILNRAAKFKNGKPIIKKLSALCPNTRYKKHEKAYMDAFIDPYVGKVYDDGATEVVSMGLQYLSNPNDLYLLITNDPEHFQYLLGAIVYMRRSATHTRTGEK